ncbi:helix-turn-helix domain-containing protein [Saccharothrix longispora]|uniref:helix-turn-helix domain-containing protein n=1 Tax=Saccharothrix longispora TaxID=33920 RepID=UPI0028FD0976|nr:helix-turn-helix domain-containing protein [Saccharothrix longispora]MDU0295050.1 helix-turn-helix domain-containing protein [Saccharothrix longispora]
MSIRVMTWVWEHAEAAGTDLLLMLAIADSADDQGRNAWPSIMDLSRKTRLDERTVQRRLRRLHDQGRIAIEAGGGRRRNRYAIAMFPPPNPSTSPPPDRPAAPVDRRASAPPARRSQLRREVNQPDHVDWPQWCGRCDGPAPQERYVDDGTGVLVPCPRCHLKGRAQASR